MQVGIFDLASSTDGRFTMQTFQCPYNKRAAVAVAFVVKMDGERILTFNEHVTLSEDRVTAQLAVTMSPAGVEAWGDVASRALCPS